MIAATLRYLCAALMALVIGGDALRAGTWTVFAAASMKTALEDIAEQYAEETGQRPVLSFAGSSVLARQISKGAPADLFISANRDWMEHLQAGGHIQAQSLRILASNRLVVIGHGTGSERVQDLTAPDLRQAFGTGRIALALTEAVPAGIYAREALHALGLWPEIEGQVVQTDNVRAALRLVALGAAPRGIVYASDAVADPAVHVIGLIPSESHSDITYPAALVAGADPAAQEFLTYLTGAAAQAVFRRHGFLAEGEAG